MHTDTYDAPDRFKIPERDRWTTLWLPEAITRSHYTLRGRAGTLGTAVASVQTDADQAPDVPDERIRVAAQLGWARLVFQLGGHLDPSRPTAAAFVPLFKSKSLKTAASRAGTRNFST